MPTDPAHQLNRSECQSDFTYSMTVKAIKIQDTGKGKKSVAGDPGAVLRKIERWHQGSIAAYFISYRDMEPGIRSRGTARKRPRENEQ